MLLRDDRAESKIAVAFFGRLREFLRRYGAPPRGTRLAIILNACFTAEISGHRDSEVLDSWHRGGRVGEDIIAASSQSA